MCQTPGNTHNLHCNASQSVWHDSSYKSKFYIDLSTGIRLQGGQPKERLKNFTLVGNSRLIIKVYSETLDLNYLLLFPCVDLLEICHVLHTLLTY